MLRLRVLAAVLIVPALPLITASPSYAAGNVICVANPGPACDQTAVSIQAAIVLATGNLLDDTISVGPGVYTDGPYSLIGNGHGLILRGSGPGTVLTLPASVLSQTYVWVDDGAVIEDLEVDMAAASSSNDHGISASASSTVQDVTVDGSGTSNATGIVAGQSSIARVVIDMAVGTGTRGVFSSGGLTLVDSTITGDQGLNLSDPGTTDTVSRTTIHATATGAAGVTTDGGTVDIDNSVIDLGTGDSAGGLQAVNFNNGTSTKTINADHVTIVGGGAGSRGAWAYAAAPGAKTTSTVTLTNSVVWGPEMSLVADAGNDGSQSGPSTAVVSVGYTDYQSVGGTIGANGAGGVTVQTGNLDVDPLFTNQASGDYHLSAGSPVIDRGDPGPDAHATDRDGAARAVDGDGNGSAIRDMGAYEAPDNIAPDTAITGGPAGPTRDTTPTFTFTSEPGVTFACQLDAGAYATCSSPFTAPALANGAHTFQVRATDTSSNTDASPASRSFMVDTVAPNTRITSKPTKVISRKRARFSFTASEAGALFQCRLDGGAWRSCSSPRTFLVKRGRHHVAFRARDAAGNVDATPATYGFRRV